MYLTIYLDRGRLAGLARIVIHDRGRIARIVIQDRGRIARF